MARIEAKLKAIEAAITALAKVAGICLGALVVMVALLVIKLL